MVVGAGGLGSPILLYLCAAGVINIDIIDFDKVDESNLNRQILYTMSDINEFKTDCAKRRLSQLNPNCNINAYNLMLDDNKLSKIVANYDVIIEAVDNAETKYMINRVCALNSKPVIMGSIKDFDGQVLIYIPGKTACYECVYPYSYIKKEKMVLWERLLE